MAEPGCVFDHAILAVKDLAEATARFARLGFTLSPPGRHPSRGTANACVMLPNGYLELLAAEGPNCIESFLLDFLADGEGLCSLALAPDDTARVQALLVAWGAANGDPVIGSRAMPTPEGERVARFAVNRVAGQPILPGRIFFCRHLDRDIVFAPHLLRHANGAQALTGMTIHGDAAEVLDDARAAALGLVRVVEAGAITLQAGDVALRIAPGPRRAKPQLTAPSLALHVPDPAQVARAAAADGLRVTEAHGAVGIALHGMELVLHPQGHD
jgi:hypothetical protein